MGNKDQGFSLIEIMVVVVIMVILATAAVSSFTFYYKTFAEIRLTNLQKLIDFSVIKARTDNTTVIVCVAAPDSFNTKGQLDRHGFNCANTRDWDDNPIVAFESIDGTVNYRSESDKIIASLPKGHNGHLYVSLSGSRTYLRISSNGFMATSNGNIVYCDKNNKYQGALITNLVGRVIYTDSKTKSNGSEYTCGF